MMFRIKELRERKKISMRQVAKDLNIPYTTYISYEKETHEPNSEILIKLADYFNCSIDYLIGRSDQEIDDSVLDKVSLIDQDILETTGNLYEAQNAQKERNSLKSIEEVFYETITRPEIDHLVKYRSLDIYGKKAVSNLLDTEYERCSAEQNEIPVIQLPKSMLRVSAGTGLQLDDEYTTWVNVPDTPTARQANIVIEVSGDSMEPMFGDGDNVLVRLMPDIDENEIGIFSVDHNAFIKKKGKQELISLNPDYENIIIDEFSEVRCFGKVLGKTTVI